MFGPAFNKEVFRKLVELDHKLDNLEEENKRLMAAIDDLKQAVLDLQASVSSEIDAVVKKLSNPASDASDINAAVASLRELKVKLDTETSTITGG